MTDQTVTSGTDPDEGTVPWYRRMFAACAVDHGAEAVLKAAIAAVLHGTNRYMTVEAKTGVPWQVLGCLHWKEASCDFRAVLHNGEKIVGTGRKTTLVPRGCGPFATWEEAAVDAINMNPRRWEKLRTGSKDIGEILYACEHYNGTGYITGSGKAETSPYLWACSNINDGRGKYVSDGHFDPDQPTDKTAGVALILKELNRTGMFTVQ